MVWGLAPTLSESVIIGLRSKSEAMRRTYEIGTRLAQSSAPLLIHGEPGAGKELMARAIHVLGSRRRRPFLKCKCLACGLATWETTLFGCTQTGIPGLVHKAAGGGILLEEIAGLPHSVQTSLMQFLDSGCACRFPGHEESESVRIIATTSESTESLTARHGVREDFLYRINVLSLHMPPLRGRQEDLPLLAESLVDEIADRTGRPVPGITPSAMHVLSSYAWPGNLTELRGALERAVMSCAGGPIGKEHLPPGLAQRISGEKQRLVEALMRSNGNRTEAARLLGMSRVTLWKKLQKHRINPEADCFVRGFKAT